MERKITCQPKGDCDNCIKLDNDPYRNCPKAQILRESGEQCTVRGCQEQIKTRATHGQ